MDTDPTKGELRQAPLLASEITAQLTENLETADAGTIEGRARKVLSGLGFTDDMQSSSPVALSGADSLPDLLANGCLCTANHLQESEAGRSSKFHLLSVAARVSFANAPSEPILMLLIAARLCLYMILLQPLKPPNHHQDWFFGRGGVIVASREIKSSEEHCISKSHNIFKQDLLWN